MLGRAGDHRRGGAPRQVRTRRTLRPSHGAQRWAAVPTHAARHHVRHGKVVPLVSVSSHLPSPPPLPPPQVKLKMQRVSGHHSASVLSRFQYVYAPFDQMIEDVELASSTSSPCTTVGGLTPGVYKYLPHSHALQPVGCTQAAAAAAAAAGAAGPSTMFGYVAVSPTSIFGQLTISPTVLFGKVTISPAPVFGQLSISPTSRLGQVTIPRGGRDLEGRQGGDDVRQRRSQHSPPHVGRLGPADGCHGWVVQADPR